MRFLSWLMPWAVSIGLIVAGMIFGSQSEPYGRSHTLWGYALMGMTCLLLGAGFAFLIWNRETGWSKGGPKHPLE